MPERRARIRIPLQSAVVLRYPRGRKRRHGRVENISHEGILIRTDTAFPPGTTLHFEIVPLPEHPHVPTLRGLILVHRAEGTAPPFEIAGTIVEREGGEGYRPPLSRSPDL
jgi:hypothetical protein